jgi:serine/threonine protein kinase
MLDLVRVGGLLRDIVLKDTLFRVHRKIGEGAFSSVSKGSWIRMGVEYDVAIKALIQNSSECDKIKLLQEAATMGQFQHPNIVKLFGVVKKGNLVRERAEGGGMWAGGEEEGDENGEGRVVEEDK